MKELLAVVKNVYETGSQERIQLGWQVSLAARGANGIVYRATGDEHDLAVKLTYHDDRDRAGREYAATLALSQSGADVCAIPLYIERCLGGLPMDVLISTWIPGKALQEAPSPRDKGQWRAILRALGAGHKLRPQDASSHIPSAVMDIREPVHLLDDMRRRLERFPADADYPGISLADMKEAFEQLSTKVPHRWDQVAAAGLILCDANPSNMIAEGDRIRLVDWENSGWADPAFDLGDLCAHPSYLKLGSEHLNWVKEEMGVLLGDQHLAQRARVYERIMWMFWIITLALLIVNPKPRLDGVHRYSPTHLLNLQRQYWELALKSGL